jgi:hypothetical protein
MQIEPLYERSALFPILPLSIIWNHSLSINCDTVDVTLMNWSTARCNHFMVWYNDEGSHIISASLPDVVDRRLGISSGLGGFRH